MTRLYHYALLMRLHRPIGIYLLLWPTLWGLWIAGTGSPSWLVSGVFILGVVLMRSAGCVINDYADRKIDPHVARTKDRPIASGQVGAKEALFLFAFLCLLAFALVLLMNRFTVYLSVIGVFLATLYPFMKRYTYFPQVYLGLAFGWAVPMVFAAETGDIPMIAWLVLLTNLLWTVAYDTAYAMTDREDDLKIGVKSTAIFFGQADKLIIALLQIIVMILLVFIGYDLALHSSYYAILTGASGFFIYQQWLIKDRDPALCFQAFLNNHWFGMLVFFAFVAGYYF